MDASTASLYSATPTDFLATETRPGLAVVVLNRSRRVLSATPEAAALLGRRAPGLVGEDFDRLSVMMGPVLLRREEQPLYGRGRRATGWLVTLESCESTPADHAVAPWADSVELVTVLTLEGNVLAANQAFARKVGLIPEACRKRQLEDWLHPADVAGWRRAREQLKHLPFRAAYETRVETARGWRWLAWEESRVNEAEGAETMYRSVGRDVTLARSAMEYLSRLASVVEQSPHSIILTTAEGQVQYVNPHYTKVTGRTLEAIFEKNLLVLREGHEDEESYQKFLEAVGAGRRWRGELSSHNASGDLRWEEVSVVPIRNHTNEITHLVCERQDITEQKHLEDRLRQTQKMESLGALAGGIAHDFNNVLAIIAGFAELSLGRSQVDPFQTRYLNEIHGATQRAIGLVRQILTFSRKNEVKADRVSLNQLIHDLGRLFTETFPRTIRFEFDLDTTLPEFLADPNQLQQVILNLCVNARDAMPEGGVLTLTTRAVAGASIAWDGADLGTSYVHISVNDTGMGMPPQIRAHIFEPFFTTKQDCGGTGLGLAVVYGVVLNHHGHIEVESTPGMGTTFHVYLPLKSTSVASEPGQPAAIEAVPKGTESILVVEDESSLRDLLLVVLRSAGYTVHTAGDGMAAIEFIRESAHPIDLVLLDLNLPKLSGFEVYKVLRQVRPATKTIVVSGNLTPAAASELRALGQNDFLAKPHRLAELGRMMREVLMPTAVPTGE